MDASDLVKAAAEAASAATGEAVKQVLREREGAERKRESVLKRELGRLALVLLKAEGELEREEYDEAFDRCEAEIESWGRQGEPEDWIDCEKIVELRVQIMSVFQSLANECDDEDGG